MTAISYNMPSSICRMQFFDEVLEVSLTGAWSGESNRGLAPGGYFGH